MRALALVFAMLCLWAPAPAEANPLCHWIGLCLYMSPGFHLIVVDAEIGRPVPDVYAWAEWAQYGGHGIGGPLMIQDATSGADGQISFPRWGPTFGSRGGLLLGTDPAVILFKPGYATLLIDNGVAPGASQYEAIRSFAQSGQTFRLQSFRGSAAEWVEQLRRLVHPALASSVSDAALARFRTHYLRRLERVEAELARLPADRTGVQAFRSSLELDRKVLTGGRP
jgi:hypothetical protein